MIASAARSESPRARNPSAGSTGLGKRIGRAEPPNGLGNLIRNLGPHAKAVGRIPSGGNSATAVVPSAGMRAGPSAVPGHKPNTATAKLPTRIAARSGVEKARVLKAERTAHAQIEIR